MIGNLSYHILLASVYSPAVPLLILMIRIDRQPTAFRWLAVYFLLSLLSDVGSLLFMKFGLNPNIPGSVNGLFCISVLSVFFYQIMNQPSLKRMLTFVNIIYFAFALLNILFLQKSGVNSYSDIFHALFVLSLSILFFYKLLQDLPTQQLHKLPLFWIISAFFFSFAGKMVIYTFSHYLVNYVGDDLNIVWTFHNFLTVIGNLVIAYGAWLNWVQIKSSSVSLERSQN